MTTSPGFLPGESHGQRSLAGYSESMGSQKVRHDWATNHKHTPLIYKRSVLWPPDVESQLIRKDPDAGKDWRQEEKGTTEDKMVGWHHRLYGHEFEQALGDGEGHRSLPICSPWGQKESHTSVQLTCPSWRKMSFNCPKVTSSMHFKLYLKAH